MKIFRHVEQIGSSTADRDSLQYLFVGDNTVLLDTGASNTPLETMFPFLQIGIDPARLALLLSMYPLHRHLLHLEEQDRVTRLRGEGHVQWKIAN